MKTKYLRPGLDVYLDRNFIAEPDVTFRELEREIVYPSDASHTQIEVGGETYYIPRQHVAYGDPGVKYRFSGTDLPAHPWIPVLSRLRDRVQRETGGVEYNFVLVNRYRDGQSTINFHRDDEDELEPEVPIVSLSFGATRCFQFRRKDEPTLKISLPGGSLLQMNHPTNVYWEHSLPRTEKEVGARVSLTFRKIRV